MPTPGEAGHPEFLAGKNVARAVNLCEAILHAPPGFWPFSLRHLERSLPSNNTMASEGGLPAVAGYNHRGVSRRGLSRSDIRGGWRGGIRRK